MGADRRAREMTEPALPPKRILRQYLIVFVLCQAFGFLILAIADAKQELAGLRYAGLWLAFSSIFAVVTGYLSIRRSWAEGTQDDIRDEVLPFLVIVALGWALWWVVHRLAA
jgi:hypothetical protein